MPFRLCKAPRSPSDPVAWKGSMPTCALVASAYADDKRERTIGGAEADLAAPDLQRDGATHILARRCIILLPLFLEYLTSRKGK